MRIILNHPGFDILNPPDNMFASPPDTIINFKEYRRTSFLLYAVSQQFREGVKELMSHKQV